MNHALAHLALLLCSDIWYWWANLFKEYSWRNVFDLFSELRGKGLRLHYWP